MPKKKADKKKASFAADVEPINVEAYLRKSRAYLDAYLTEIEWLLNVDRTLETVLEDHEHANLKEGHRRITRERLILHEIVEDRRDRKP